MKLKIGCVNNTHFYDNKYITYAIMDPKQMPLLGIGTLATVSDRL